MRLSRLQRFILVESHSRRSSPIAPHEFSRFYQGQKDKPSAKDRQTILTRSIERMIDHELAVGYGRRTPHKWYIEAITLTARGRRLAKSLLGRQPQLPLKKRRSA